MTTTALLFALAAAPGLLVSPADLAGMLTDPAVIVLHAEQTGSDFPQGHVPGARPIRFVDFAVDGPDDLRSELPPVDTLRAVFERAGVGAKSRVVIYGSPIVSTRAFFSLDYLGHPNVKVLNGGLAAWRAEGRPVQTGEPAPSAPETGSLARLTVRPDVLAHATWLVERLQSPRMALVDARPDAEFTGDDNGMDGAHVPGHLAGATQLVWTDLVSRSSQFLPDDQLRAKLVAAGAKSGVPVVSYCMIGMRASVVYFVARHLGFDARMYDGSIVDWTRRKLPAVRGRGGE
jgi:thiosulfate/3-mercaptopyruvate sulfurtransferase